MFIRPRLIPACAGKTFSKALCLTAHRAHPRVCGENISLPSPNLFAVGSSPRVRGKLLVKMLRTDRARLIPACAGKTRPTRAFTTAHRAHPRVCGENLPSPETLAQTTGSSPRVRGKRCYSGLTHFSERLIPACAGKTWNSTRGKVTRRAHPRVCGENRGDAVGSVTVTGSSPRVRGKHISGHRRPRLPRLIPACAGKTAKSNTSAGTSRAHPRVCGENRRRRCLMRSLLGSSPRVRGKRRCQVARRLGQWLIPACAGKTRRPQDLQVQRRAHPRVCGEN